MRQKQYRAVIHKETKGVILQIQSFLFQTRGHIPESTIIQEAIEKYQSSLNCSNALNGLSFKLQNLDSQDNTPEIS
jgi:hypothetical protein